MTLSPRSAVRRLAIARAISLTGGAAAFAALNFVIYERTGSAAWVAAALFLTFGTVGIASLFAGALGDRFDRRRVMILSDLAGAGCFAAMAFVDDPGLLLVVAFLSALAEAPFMAASMAAIPNLVPDEDLAWANGTIALGRNLGILVGPAAGGALVAVTGGGPVFLANAASFLVSAWLVWTVRLPFSQERRDDEHAGISAGLRFLVRDRVLRAITLAWLILVLGLGMTMVADVPLAEFFGTGALGYGILISVWGGGSIAGSLAGRWLRPRTEPVALMLGAAAVAVTAVATGLSPWWMLVLGAIFVMGIGDGLASVANQGIMQRRTPDSVRSRVSGAMDAVVHGGLALSYLVGGPLVDAIGPRNTYLVGGVISLGAVVAMAPAVRSRGASTGDASSGEADLARREAVGAGVTAGVTTDVTADAGGLLLGPPPVSGDAASREGASREVGPDGRVAVDARRRRG